jgi:glycosyltransferase involved in cell wall biosynthesis
VVGVSRNSLRFYPWRQVVIPNAVDIDRFAPRSHRSPDPTVLFVGTYRGRKGGRLLVEAFTNDVLPKVPEAHLWMVCTDAPAAPRVEVLGRLTDDELAERYRSAWVFCLPSSYEGFGIPYIEAMASGLRIVATPNRGAKEVLAGCASAEFVEPTQLGAAITSALDCPPGVPVPSIVKRYAWPAVVSQYEELYS